MEDGLPGNNVTCIVQDSQGFMWFGTTGGLVRYDGYKCKIYQNNPNDPGSISYNYISSLFTDSKGTLWIGTMARGLDRYVPEQDKFVSYKLDVNDSTSISGDHFVDALFEDHQGQLWIGTAFGLNRYDTEHDCFIRYTNTIVDSSGIRPEWVTCIYEDRQNHFWLGTPGAGLVLYDRKTRKGVRFKNNPADRHSISNNYINSIFEDKNGLLWVSTDAGYNYFRFTDEHIKFMHPEKEIPSGISSKTVYDLFDTKGSYKLANAVPQADFSDNRGNIWIATMYGGVKYYNASQNAFHTYKYQHGDPNGLKNSSVLALYENGDGQLWIGVDHGGLHLYDRNKNRFIYYPLDPQKPDDPFEETVICIEEDSFGNLWIGTWAKGVYKMDQKNGKSVHYMPEPDDSSSLNCPTVFAIFEDSRKNIWLGTYGKGMSTYDRKNNCFIASHEIYKHLVRNFFEDSQQNFWICTSPGLYLYNRDSRTYKEWQPDPNDENSLSDNSITFVYEDIRDNIWVGTGWGLNLYDPVNDSFTVFTVKDGLPNGYMAGILEDDHGYLWLSTRNGLSKFDPVNKTFTNFDVNDGLQDNQFNTNACVKSRSGELIFGGVNGFTLFHPDSIKAIENIPTVVITGFQIFNKTVKPGEKNSPLQKDIRFLNEITLPYYKHSLSFEFAVLDYVSPRHNHYKYMLEGFHDDWVETDADLRVATYTNLAPGKYVFRVIGSNNKGTWNNKGVSVKIIITPPWWRTPLAYILYIILTCLVVWLIWNAQLRRVHIKHELEMKQFEADKLQELDQMKSRFFANISHEIRTPLTLILGPLEQLLSETSKEKIKKPLQLMFRNGRQLVRLINQLLDFSKLESGRMSLKTKEINIVPLLKGMVYSFDSLAKRKKITLSFKSEENAIAVYIDTDKLEKIMANLLSNAFKFTSEAGKISVELSIIPKDIKENQTVLTEDKIVEIRVIDSGIGIAPEHLDHIFDRYYQIRESKEQKGTGIGLALTKELVELHHGQIFVRSEPGKGSTFIVHFLSGRAHLGNDEISDDETAEISEYERIPEEYESVSKDAVKPSAGFIDEETFKTSEDHPIILIVEDTEDVRNYIRGFLESKYRISEAQDGDDGFEKALEIIPDLIISDVMMPKMDGFQLCEKLKTDERTSHIPVILLTARASEGSKLEGLETGADDYIIKPFNSKELEIRIKNLIEQRQKLRERFTKDITIAPKEISVTSADERFLNRAIELIEKHISDQDFGVDIFGREIGLSHSQLHRKVRALTNHSPVEFIRTMRLKRAVSLLEQGYGNVAEIAYEVGFNNPSYFSECFRKQFGKSPSEFAASTIT